MNARPWIRWVVRTCEALAAAIVLLVLAQLHTAIVYTALTMVGARTDVPLIVAVEDRCKTHFIPPAWRPARGAQRRYPCAATKFR
jgi:hypothetical protein